MYSLYSITNAINLSNTNTIENTLQYLNTLEIQSQILSKVFKYCLNTVLCTHASCTYHLFSTVTIKLLGKPVGHFGRISKTA